jgi:hypothetical protein
MSSMTASSFSGGSIHSPPFRYFQHMTGAIATVTLFTFPNSEGRS